LRDRTDTGSALPGSLSMKLIDEKAPPFNISNYVSTQLQP
jgi:hypothetical protein